MSHGLQWTMRSYETTQKAVEAYRGESSRTATFLKNFFLQAHVHQMFKINWMQFCSGAAMCASVALHPHKNNKQNVDNIRFHVDIKFKNSSLLVYYFRGTITAGSTGEENKQLFKDCVAIARYPELNRLTSKQRLQSRCRSLR